MTIQEWAREARKVLESSRMSHHYCEDSWYSCPKAEGGCSNDEVGEDCNCGADEHNGNIENLLSTYPESESGKESDTVQKKLELYGSMVINVRSLRTFLTQYHPSYTQWIEEIDFILARAAELDKEWR
jgi:hypothetical protein